MDKTVEYFLKQLEADNSSKNQIENILVDLGINAVPELVKYLTNVTGIVRGVVAMSLIRIGKPSVSYLKNMAKNSEKEAWMAEYLISEINSVAA